MNQRAIHIPSLDVLRGFALCGIIFANIYEMGGYSALPKDVMVTYSSGFLNQSILWFNDVFIRYKFYTIFSFLFGIGFSILSPSSLSYIKRLTLLFIFGWFNALFILYGDILRIYALAGLCLLFLRDLKDRQLLIAAAVSLFIPTCIAIFKYVTHSYVNPLMFFIQSNPRALSAIQSGPWLDLVQVNYERALMHFSINLTGGRFFRILGLFLIGYYAGRNQLLHRFKEYLPEIKHLLPYAWMGSIVTNIYFVYYFSQMNPIEKEFAYVVSVYPLSMCYIVSVIYLCQIFPKAKFTQILANVGRMSLTNYLLSGILAGLIMRWYGLGFGGHLTVAGYCLAGFFIMIVLMFFSTAWLKYCHKGLFEIILRSWR